MKKCRNIIICILVLMIVGTGAFGCAEKSNLPSTGEGYAPDMRRYGDKYNIMDYESGNYYVAYSIEDTSLIGKMMVEKNCNEYSKVSVNKNNVKFAFTVKSSDIIIKSFSIMDKDYVPSVNNESSYYINISKEELVEKIFVKGYVKAMNKNIEFSIILNVEGGILTDEEF